MKTIKLPKLLKSVTQGNIFNTIERSVNAVGMSTRPPVTTESSPILYGVLGGGYNTARDLISREITSKSNTYTPHPN